MEGFQSASASVLWRVQRFDLIVAAALVVVTQRDVWSQQDVAGGARVALAAIFVVATAALFWRRRAALLCAALIAVGLVAETAISGGDISSAGWALAALVGLYSAGAYLELRLALVAFAILVGGLAARELRDLGSYAQDPYQGAFWWLLVVAAFGGGVYVRSRRQARSLRRTAEQSELESAQATRAAVVEERARIARELHDVVAQDVGAVVLQAQAAEELLRVEPERARESLHAIQRLGREALSEMRNSLGILRRDGDDELAPQPTLAGLPILIERARAAGLVAELRIAGVQRVLPPGLEVSAYRVTQEALTNVRKHAPGARATVLVRYEPSVVSVEVTNTRTAAPTNGHQAGHGLVGMRERVSFFGGDFSTGPTSDGGYSVRATFPTPPAAD